jgi:membrane protein
MSIRSLGALLLESTTAFLENNPFQLAAALSYYTLLSLAPILLVVVGMVGLVFGGDVVREGVVTQMRGLVGEAGAEVIRTVIAEAGRPGKGVVSLVIGIVTLIIGASTVFGQLQSALNRIWEVEAAPAKNAIGSFIRTRILSLAMVIGIGFLLLVSLIVSAALAALDGYLQTTTALPAGLWQALNLLTSLMIIALLFAMMFKLLPDVKLAWRDVVFGAFVTAALFTAGKYLIGLYLGHASIGSSYGAAGSVVVLMVWVYYSALIVFLGAEITQVRWRRRRGTSAAPSEHAVHKAR